MPISQYKLHGIAVQCGFKIVQFSDHPDFFSSWSIAVNKGGRSYLIEHDGRGGWLIFYRESAPAKFEELDKRISHTMSDCDKASQCEVWLLAAK